MPNMICYGAELLRINTEKNRIEYSSTDGRSWNSRNTSSSYGRFMDLVGFGAELLILTSKGIYSSKNAGRSIYSRWRGSSYGELLSLTDTGGKLILTTTKGTYASKNEGRSWSKI